MTAPSLDGRTFAMVSSTASRVDPDAPTVFRYVERDGRVGGTYTGDTVRTGRFAGTRSGDTIRVAFEHLTRSGDRVSGEATSAIEVHPDGLRLVERFGAEGEHTSVCREVSTLSDGGVA